MKKSPLILPVVDIRKRLQAIFPEGCPNRNTCVWEIAARTVFVMLYVGAVEGRNVWIRPDQVTRMTDAQSSLADDTSRREWGQFSMRGQKGEIPGRWYAVNTRESIRDDTLRSGLIPNGAVVERQGLPTTSPAPRYALQPAFAALFDPALSGNKLSKKIEGWRAAHLSAGAMARIAIRRKGAAAFGEHVSVLFPNGETRRMAPGPSSVISKAVIEQFVPRFLEEPAVIFLSESAQKIVARDEDLARSIGLEIQADKNLPDILLVDLGPDHPLLIFVEVVATDGSITEERKTALQKVVEKAGFPTRHIAFVTAYLDRSAPAFKKTVDSLAWGSFVWFSSEPEQLLALFDGQAKHIRNLSDLL